MTKRSPINAGPRPSGNQKTAAPRKRRGPGKRIDPRLEIGEFIEQVDGDVRENRAGQKQTRVQPMDVGLSCRGGAADGDQDNGKDEKRTADLPKPKPGGIHVWLKVD
jgi:hypothetical protein